MGKITYHAPEECKFFHRSKVTGIARCYNGWRENHNPLCLYNGCVSFSSRKDEKLKTIGKHRCTDCINLKSICQGQGTLCGNTYSLCRLEKKKILHNMAATTDCINFYPNKIINRHSHD